jgi:hypothetical protein
MASLISIRSSTSAAAAAAADMRVRFADGLTKQQEKAARLLLKSLSCPKSR